MDLLFKLAVKWTSIHAPEKWNMYVYQFATENKNLRIIVVSLISLVLQYI